jgi:hypothetical protein
MGDLATSRTAMSDYFDTAIQMNKEKAIPAMLAYLL